MQHARVAHALHVYAPSHTCLRMSMHRTRYAFTMASTAMCVERAAKQGCCPRSALLAHATSTCPHCGGEPPRALPFTYGHPPRHPTQHANYYAAHGLLSDRLILPYACAHRCALQGEALRLSEERLAIIGNSASIRSVLTDWHGLIDLLRREPAEVIAQLDNRLMLMAAECLAGHFPGVECWLVAFVQFGDAAASGLATILERLPHKLIDARSQLDAESPPESRVKLPVGQPVHSSSSQLALPSESRVKLPVSQPGGQVHMISISPSEIAAKAAAYRSAARRWASTARSVTADLEGKDSPAYAVWCAALGEHGCCRKPRR